MIPDIKIYEIVQSCIEAVRVDFDSHTNPQDSILWYLLNSSKMQDTGKYRWYEQAVEIFITRNKEHPRYLDSRLFFDKERASIPTVHVMMLGENKGKDGIGFDEGFKEAQTLGTNSRKIFNRQYDINANIVATSDNTFETVIIYHVIKSMLESLNTHIQLLGFINPIFSGRNIEISQELVPSGTYSKAINFTAGYELDVPEVTVNTIASAVWIQMNNINGQQLNSPIGPGPISND